MESVEYILVFVTF